MNNTAMNRGVISGILIYFLLDVYLLEGIARLYGSSIFYLIIDLLFAVLGLELRVYILSQSIRPFM
jgi:hypothetical protein